MVWQTVIILVQAVIIALACVGGVLGWRKAWQLSMQVAELRSANRTQAQYKDQLEARIELTEESNRRLRAHIDNKPITKPVKQSDRVARTAADVRRITAEVWGEKPDVSRVQQ